MMGPDDRLLELLLAWQEQYDRGLDPSPAELGAEDALRPELRGRIARRKRLYALMGLSQHGGVPDPGPGIVVPGFSGLEEIGQGGMGVVYRAWQDQPRRLIALKVVRPERVSDLALRRFELELNVLGRLRHPGIAALYEAGQTPTPAGPRPFFAMEYVDGRRLTHYADDEGLDVRARVALMIRVCQAVQYAHQQGIIHRDLKPENILVDREGQPKVLDFGLARALDPTDDLAASLTDALFVPGTIPYMSPEQAGGRRDAVDTRSDQYSLGLILYELLAGHRAFRLAGLSRLESLRVVEQGQVTPLRQVDRRFRGDLDTIVGKALRHDKDRRYASCAEFAADLQRFLDDRPIVARSASGLYQFRKLVRRNRALSAVAAASLLALVVGLVALFGLWRQSESYRVSAETNLAKAETNLGQAFDAIDQFYDEFERRPELDRPDLAHLRRRFSEKGLEVVGGLVVEYRRNPRARRKYIIGLGRLAQIQANLQSHDEARETVRQALAEAEDWLRESPDDEDRRDALADVLHVAIAQEGDPARCLDLYRRSEEIREPIATAELTAGITANRLLNRFNAAIRIVGSEIPDLRRQGIEIFREVCELGNRAIAAGEPTATLLDAVGRSDSTLASIESGAGRRREAEALLRRSNDHFRRRFERQPDRLPFLLDYCNAMELLATFLLAGGTLEDYEESLRVGQEIVDFVTGMLDRPGWRPDERFSLHIQTARTFNNIIMAHGSIQAAVEPDPVRYKRALDDLEAGCRRLHALATSLRPLMPNHEDLRYFDCTACANIYSVMVERSTEPQVVEEAKAWLRDACKLLPADPGRIENQMHHGLYRAVRQLGDEILGPEPPPDRGDTEKAPAGDAKAVEPRPKRENPGASG